MRKIARVLLVATVAMSVLAVFGTPSWAVGGGQVTGNVHTGGIGGCTNGDPLCRKPQGLITFSGVIISGAFVSNDGSQQFLGQVKVGTSNSVTASSTTGATLADDAGIVNPFSVDETSGTSLGTISNGSPLNGNGCKGTYTRAGSIVLVQLTCKFSITGPAGGAAGTFSGPVTVVAQFTPTTGDGITTPVTDANFSGVYAVAA